MTHPTYWAQNGDSPPDWGEPGRWAPPCEDCGGTGRVQISGPDEFGLIDFDDCPCQLPAVPVSTFVAPAQQEHTTAQRAAGDDRTSRILRDNASRITLPPSASSPASVSSLRDDPTGAPAAFSPVSSGAPVETFAGATVVEHPAAPIVRAVAVAEHYRIFGCLPSWLR